METKQTNFDNSQASAYVRSLRDAVKRRYAGEYLTWIRAGRQGSAPSRGALSPTLWKMVTSNLDSLA